MSCKVLVTADIHPKGIEYLKDNACQVVNESGEKLKNVADYVDDCNGILTRTELIDTAVYERGKNLRVVGKHGVGVDNIDVQGATDRGIRIVNAPEANTDSVVEHTLSLILAIAKNILMGDYCLRRGDYHSRDRILSVEVMNKTIGLIGLGRIGLKVAMRAAYGLGMQVIAYDPYIKKEDRPENIKFVESIKELVSASDFVSLHLPHNQHTEGLIGRDAFNDMKPEAYLINVARGPIVDELALVAALEERKIAGAALDVYAEEPPIKDNPLFALDNVIVTPHNAALTKEAKVKMAVHAAQGIVEILQGRKPTWPVN